jgi:hypothetical protein
LFWEPGFPQTERPTAPQAVPAAASAHLLPWKQDSRPLSHATLEHNPPLTDQADPGQDITRCAIPGLQTAAVTDTAMSVMQHTQSHCLRKPRNLE